MELNELTAWGEHELNRWANELGWGRWGTWELGNLGLG